LRQHPMHGRGHDVRRHLRHQQRLHLPDDCVRSAGMQRERKASPRHQLQHGHLPGSDGR
jgi:hypothetical protein